MAANVSSPRPTSDDSHSNRAKVSHGVNAIRKSLDALYEDMEKRPRVWRRALGLFLLGVVIIFWTVSGFLTSVSPCLTLVCARPLVLRRTSNVSP